MEELALRRKIIIMLALMASMMFASLNQTIIGTALPRIVSEIGGMNHYSWVLSIFMLSSTVAGALVGKLSDLYGRKPFIVAGILVFMAGCLLCGFSRTIIQLIVFRAIQGLGGGIIMSTSMTAVGDLFTPRERGRWAGMVGSVFAISSIAGPALGGYIVEFADWHWVFWIFLPLGVVALSMIWWLFPSVPKRRNEKIDFKGMAYLVAFVVPLLLALSRIGGDTSWRSPAVLVSLGAALVALFLFVRTERRAPHPMMPLHMFRNRSFVASNLAIMASQFGMFGVIMYMPLYVQGVLGLSAAVSGYVTSPLMVSMVFASAISGQIVTRTGRYKKQAMLGMAVMCFGLFLLTRLEADASVASVVSRIVLIGLGMGITNPILNVSVQNSVPDRMLGVATSTMQLFRQIGSTIGVTVAGSFITANAADRMREYSERAGLDADRAAELSDPQILVNKERLEELAADFSTPDGTSFETIIAALRDSLNDAVSGAFVIGLVMAFIAFGMVSTMKEVPLRNYRTRDEDPPQDAPVGGGNVPASGR